MSSQALQTFCNWMIFVGAILGVVGTITAATGALGSYHFGLKVQKEKDDAAAAKEKETAARTADTGLLAVEPKVVLSGNTFNAPILEIGDSGTMLRHTGKEGQSLLKFADDNRLVILQDKDGIKISTQIKNKKGELVAELINNEWKINKNNSWDRNYTSNALEVKDNTGDVVLQVKLLEDRVQFQGKLYDSQGTGIALLKSKYKQRPGGLIQVAVAGRSELTEKIKPIFRYPSDRHFGELINPDN